MAIFCTETGRGEKASVFVCSLEGTDYPQIIIKAKKIAPHKYDVYSIKPLGRFKIIMYASTRSELRKKIEEWLEKVGGEDYLKSHII